MWVFWGETGAGVAGGIGGEWRRGCEGEAAGGQSLKDLFEKVDATSAIPYNIRSNISTDKYTIVFPKTEGKCFTATKNNKNDYSFVLVQENSTSAPGMPSVKKEGQNKLVFTPVLGIQGGDEAEEDGDAEEKDGDAEGKVDEKPTENSGSGGGDGGAAGGNSNAPEATQMTMTIQFQDDNGPIQINLDEKYKNLICVCWKSNTSSS